MHSLRRISAYAPSPASESDAIKQILELWVGAQVVKGWIHFQADQLKAATVPSGKGLGPGGKQVVASYDKEDIKALVHGDTAVMGYRFVIRIQTGGNDIYRRYRTNTEPQMRGRNDRLAGRWSPRTQPIWNPKNSNRA
jgi:hypothetical protein